MTDEQIMAMSEAEALTLVKLLPVWTSAVREGRHTLYEVRAISVYQEMTWYFICRGKLTGNLYRKEKDGSFAG